MKTGESPSGVRYCPRCGGPAALVFLYNRTEKHRCEGRCRGDGHFTVVSRGVRR